MADKHCQGTLAPAAIRILTVLCCYSHQDPHWYTVHRTSRPHFCPCTTPPYEITLLCSRVSVTGFSPVHFLGPQSRPVSCYAIFKGWLLLSPPPGCFRLPTPFRITLDRNLGTLTIVWVVSLMATKLTPDGLAPDVYGERKFGV